MFSAQKVPSPPQATRLWNSARDCLAPVWSFQKRLVASPKVQTVCPVAVVFNSGSRVTLPMRMTLFTDFMNGGEKKYASMVTDDGWGGDIFREGFSGTRRMMAFCRGNSGSALAWNMPASPSQSPAFAGFCSSDSFDSSASSDSSSSHLLRLLHFERILELFFLCLACRIALPLLHPLDQLLCGFCADLLELGNAIPRRNGLFGRVLGFDARLQLDLLDFAFLDRHALLGGGGDLELQEFDFQAEC